VRSRLIPAFFAVAVLAPSATPVSAARSAELDCLIEPYVVVALSSSVEGLVEAVTVDRGDLVKEGQVLVRLESSVEKAAVAVARARAEMESGIQSSQARVEFGVRRFVRTEGLFKQDLVPLKEMDEAETAKVLAEIGLIEAKENKSLAELEWERAAAALALRTIRSPITGVVLERSLSPGEFAKQAPILKLAQIDPLRIEVIAPVSWLGKVAVGMRAELLPEAPVSGLYAARVTVVDRVVDAASGTFGVRLEMPNPGYRLPAGLKCKVRFLQ